MQEELQEQVTPDMSVKSHPGTEAEKREKKLRPSQPRSRTRAPPGSPAGTRAGTTPPREVREVHPPARI